MEWEKLSDDGGSNGSEPEDLEEENVDNSENEVTSSRKEPQPHSTISADVTGIKAEEVHVTNSQVITNVYVGAAVGDSSLPDSKGAELKKKEVERVKPSWNAVANVLSAVTPCVPKTVTYGGHIFICEARPYFHKWEMLWKGKCADQETGFETVCKGTKAAATSVRRAAAKLIREMVEQKKYPEPYDVADMPTKE